MVLGERRVMAKLYGDRQLGYQFDKKVYTKYAIEKRALECN
jgi:hypothetical protein